jgi:hypothetical protein
MIENKEIMFLLMNSNVDSNLLDVGREAMVNAFNNHYIWQRSRRTISRGVPDDANRRALRESIPRLSPASPTPALSPFTGCRGVVPIQPR